MPRPQSLVWNTTSIFLFILFHCQLYLQITVHNNPTLAQSEVEISNTLLIDPQVDNLEVAMRFSTDIKNGDVFYTDQNGMHVCIFKKNIFI